LQIGQEVSTLEPVFFNIKQPEEQCLDDDNDNDDDDDDIFRLWPRSVGSPEFFSFFNQHTLLRYHTQPIFSPTRRPLDADDRRACDNDLWQIADLYLVHSRQSIGHRL
jgi:hypothetical protein